MRLVSGSAINSRPTRASASSTAARCCRSAVDDSSARSRSNTARRTRSAAAAPEIDNSPAMNGPSRTCVAAPGSTSSGRNATMAPTSIAIVTATDTACTRTPHGTSSAVTSIFTAT